MGEPLLISDKTLNRDNLARDRVLTLIPYNHICPKLIKVVTERRSFSISIWEDQEHISYSRILGCLGLDWEEHVGEFSSGSKIRKENREGEEVAMKPTNQSMS